MSDRHRRWCYTINNFTNADYQDFKPGIYGQHQGEIAPTTGTRHLQGFACFSSAMTLAALKELHPRAHWISMRGSLEDNEAYTSKLDGRIPECPPIRWGTRPAPGKRSDLAAVIDLVRESATADDAIIACIDVAPASALLHQKYIRELHELIGPTAPAFDLEVMYPWQIELCATIDIKPVGRGDRKIHWIYDTVGGTGKSTFVAWYTAKNPTRSIIVEGKFADMAYMWKEKYEVAFFDIARSQQEYVDHYYVFAEKLKNGAVGSTKYQSKMKRFIPPHVVFFANCLPDPTKWSQDRYAIRDITPAQVAPIFHAATLVVPEEPEVIEVYEDPDVTLVPDLQETQEW